MDLITIAKTSYFREHKTEPDVDAPFSELTKVYSNLHLRGKVILDLSGKCPLGGIYTTGSLHNEVSCSIHGKKSALQSKLEKTVLTPQQVAIIPLLLFLLIPTYRATGSKG
jgi:hypothetical protein